MIFHLDGNTCHLKAFDDIKMITCFFVSIHFKGVIVTKKHRILNQKYKFQKLIKNCIYN